LDGLPNSVAALIRDIVVGVDYERHLKVASTLTESSATNIAQQTDANSAQTRMENIEELINHAEKIYTELIDDHNAQRVEDASIVSLEPLLAFIHVPAETTRPLVCLERFS
jgi:precorrin-6B methylase 1